MNVLNENDLRTTVERRPERELVVTRTFDGAARLVFAAWTTPELLERWWAPAPIAFLGRYLEVVPDSLLVWTNEEGGGGRAGRHGHLHGVGRQDAGRHARPLFREGCAR